mmetsp:Transcript_5942/g.19117  ORF Transcript_5942/g.19117 Transcript_5942/m.19117 type:complete len:206 (+) Transcript_5942:1646-2263(+)
MPSPTVLAPSAAAYMACNTPQPAHACDGAPACPSRRSGRGALRLEARLAPAARLGPAASARPIPASLRDVDIRWPRDADIRWPLAGDSPLPSQCTVRLARAAPTAELLLLALLRVGREPSLRLPRLCGSSRQAPAPMGAQRSNALRISAVSMAALCSRPRSALYSVRRGARPAGQSSADTLAPRADCRRRVSCHALHASLTPTAR